MPVLVIRGHFPEIIIILWYNSGNPKDYKMQWIKHYRNNPLREQNKEAKSGNTDKTEEHYSLIMPNTENIVICIPWLQQ